MTGSLEVLFGVVVVRVVVVRVVVVVGVRGRQLCFC